MEGEATTELIDGRFELGPLIGRGAMGDVFRGNDVRLGRPVAIKCLRRDVASDTSAVERFAEEARSAARLSHPSIVTVYDSGVWNGVPYLVMECLPGRTLADEMSAAPLPAAAVRRVATDLFAALAVAHGGGVVHRDVKPGNVLLAADGRAKLADFGIAKSSESLDHTRTGLIVGTPAYLAPERLDGRPATAAGDVYALGVVLYEALAGDKPFRGDTPIALAHAVHSTTPVPLRERNPSVDPELAAVVDAAMARDPDARPTAAALYAHLDRPAQGSATTTMPAVDLPTVTTTASPAPAAALAPARRAWADTSPEVRAIVVIVALFALVLGGIALLGNGDGDATAPPASVTTVPGAEIPQPLDDALDRLEETVRP